MITALERQESLIKRHFRVRKKISGTSERLRLSVHRSHLNLQVQLVDDMAQKTVFSLSTLDADFQKKVHKSGTVEAAKLFGQFLAAQMKKKGFSKIAFDRGGWLYHGRIKMLAETLRENGVEF